MRHELTVLILIDDPEAHRIVEQAERCSVLDIFGGGRHILGVWAGHIAVKELWCLILVVTVIADR